MQAIAHGTPACSETPLGLPKVLVFSKRRLCATAPLQHWQSKLSYMTPSSLQVVLDSLNVSQRTYWSVPRELHICSH